MLLLAVAAFNTSDYARLRWRATPHEDEHYMYAIAL